MLGINQSGQLGDNSTRIDPEAVKVQAAGGGDLSNVVSVAPGGNHSLRLLSRRMAREHYDRNVYCWGDNNKAIECDGCITNAHKLARKNFSCSLLTDKTVKCRGDNDAAQIAKNKETTQYNFHKRGSVLGCEAYWVMDITAGDDLPVFMENGQVRCWGNNSDGQIGSGSGAPSAIPQVVQFNNGTSNVALEKSWLGCRCSSRLCGAGSTGIQPESSLLG